MNEFSFPSGTLGRIAIVLALSASVSDPATAQLPDPAVLDRAGELAYARSLKAAAPRGAPVNLPPSATRIRQVANRLVVQTSSLGLERPGYTWSFSPLPGETPRLDVYPGGRVIVNAGWIERLKLSDDELAAALAHALAHLLLGQIDARAAARSADYADPDPNRAALRLAEAIDKSQNEPWTAEQERDADRIGVQLAARSGYDPRAAITFWHKVDASGVRALIAAHPMDDARVAALEAQMPDALKLLAAARASAAKPTQLPAQIRRRSP